MAFSSSETERKKRHTHTHTHTYIWGGVTGSQGKQCLKGLIVLLSRQVDGMVISYTLREQTIGSEVKENNDFA